MTRASEPRSLTGELFRNLLVRFPNARVGASGADGIFVEPPAGLPGDPIDPSFRSASALVSEADRVPVTHAWYAALDEGAATVEVELVGTPGRATIHLLDVRDEYGCFVQVAVPADDRPWTPMVRPTDTADRTPRTVRFHKDVAGVVEWVDPLVEQLLGWTPDDLIGERTGTFLHPDDHDRAIEAWLDLVTADGVATRVKARHRTRDGRWKWLEITNRNLLERDGHVECEVVDISAEMDAQAALRASAQLLRQLAAALPVGVLHVDVDGRVQYANQRCREILGIEGGEDDPQAFARTLASVGDPTAVLDAIADGSELDVEMTVHQPSVADVRRCTLAIRPLTDDEGRSVGAVACLSDVTESLHLRDELARRALTDPLTGCLNRTGITTVLERSLAENRDRVAVVFVDLDGFKEINDRFGHRVGDRVLQHVGDMLHRSIRRGDAVGRVGGDEFLVVCSEVESDRSARAIAERIESMVTSPMSIGDGWRSVGASVGVHRVTGHHGDGIQDIIAKADAAMYATKLRRRRQLVERQRSDA